jgi:hypothetical protein
VLTFKRFCGQRAAFQSLAARQRHRRHGDSVIDLRIVESKKLGAPLAPSTADISLQQQPFHAEFAVEDIQGERAPTFLATQAAKCAFNAASDSTTTVGSPPMRARPADQSVSRFVAGLVCHAIFAALLGNRPVGKFEPSDGGGTPSPPSIRTAFARAPLGDVR